MYFNVFFLQIPTRYLAACSTRIRMDCENLHYIKIVTDYPEIYKDDQQAARWFKAPNVFKYCSYSGDTKLFSMCCRTSSNKRKFVYCLLPFLLFIYEHF
jgi:hypothetical protein